MRILARHEGGPGGGAGGLDVVLVQQDPLRCQLLQAGAVDVGVVPGHVVPAWARQRVLCNNRTLADSY